MGKITKTMQVKHRETLSPWLKGYVESASTIAIPLLPQHLATYPTRWPFGRGDLYHWIPLLNRFDTILEAFCRTYKLNEGPQTIDFGCQVLQNVGDDAAFAEEKSWSLDELKQQGFASDGDRELVEAVLVFTRLLLEHCGNRSIYASSAHLSDLLNSTSLSVLITALEVGSELAQRYQASVKRIGNASRHISTALLANHYNVDLERVQQIAQAFTKTSIVSLSDPTPNATPSATPTPSKGKEKALTHPAAKNTAKSHANDLVAVITSDDKRWAGWGDVRIQYYPDDSKGTQGAITEPGKSSQPSTPTPLRRSSTMGATQQTPKGRNPPGDDSSPLWPRTPGPGEDAEVSGQKAFELPQSMVVASTMSQLLDKLPADMPQSSKYEAFHRFRVAKALTGSPLARQQILATRLLAITNLAYIHTESSFVEKVLRQDMDETRRYQLVYQLAELIHPSTEGNVDIPLWLQTFALGLLEAVSSFHSRCQDVLSALNANVNHGVLLYVIRKAVAGMEQDEGEGDYEQVTEIDNWRNNLFSLTLNLSMATRVGAEMASAGLMDILVHILNIRSKVAERHHSMVLAFLDGLIWAYPNAFNAFFTADGLDSVSKLVVDTVADSKKLVAANNGIKPDQQSSAVDYEVPYYHQQTLKWLLKFIHRVMSNSYNYSGNTERLLRNLAEKSDLLAGLRQVISDKKCFGSVIWTNSVMILSDFINNDPTSYVAISESGMIRTYLEAVTGKPLAESALEEDAKGETEHEENDTSESAAVTAMIERDDRSHPPTEEMLRAADATAPKAAGILATSEAINVVPQVLNSISLNTSGMKLVIASQALDSYFEIFESPEHVRCMELDIDLAGTVGGSFDELARHHPPLRTAISNAVIDMVARVRHLGIQKAENAGWGARLFANDGDGKMVSINEQGNVDNARSASQKGKAPSQPDQPVDSDVAMLDLTTSTSVETEDKDGESDAGSAHESFTPYIYAVSNFLTTYVSSSFLKNNFIDKGGIELLLDICESPSLPANYGDSMASRVLNQVISMLLEQAPVRGLPSLLRRAQSAIDVLQPLSSKAEALPPYFGPFLGTDISLTSAAAPENMRNGTKIIKALLNAQTFIKIVSECFSTSRSHSLQFYPVNVYDYYVVLVRSMGPLLRGVLAEEAGELSAVPQHWSLKRRGAVSEGDTRSGSDAATEHTSLPDVMKDTGSWKTAEGSDAPTAPTEEEQSTARYQNYETLRLLLHPMIPTSFPLFQSLGKALLPKRELTHGDTYPLPRQRQIAKELAATVLNHLSPSVASNEPGSKEFHYWIIMLHTIHEMLIDHPTGRGLDRANVHIILPVLLAFKEQKGLDVLNSMLKIFAAAVREGAIVNTDESSKSKVAAFGLKKVLDLYGVLVNGKNIIDTHTQFNPLRLTDRTQTVPHIFQQLVVELRYAVLPVLLDLWDSPFVEHVSDATAKRILDILKQISAAEHEPPITPKDKVPFQLLNYTDVRFDWTPLHGTIDDLRSAGYEESLVHEAVFRANGNLSASREYCRAHKAGLAGERNPIPAEDADVNASRSSEQSTSRQRAPSGAGVSEADRMSLDTFTEEAGESGRDDGESISASAVSRSASNHSTSGGGKAAPADESQRGQFPGTKEDLDKLRAKLRGNLIDQSLDVIRIHPDSAIEVSELIHTMVLQNQDQDAQEEVGSTLTFALSSLAMDGEEKKKNGKCIAAYAHLLALLLQDENFFEYNLDALRDKVDEYVAFLKIPPSGSGDELPPWIPYILLVLEPLLSHDERPVAAQWKPPKTLEGEVASPVVQLGASLVDDQQRTDILDSLLDLLPRVGKEEVLATSILRILVILTRRRRLAKHVGEKKNLQRLFLMAKQLSGHGAERLKQIKLTAHIITVLRHVIEDEEVLRQIVRAEIKAEFPAVQRNNRGHADIAAFLRTMAPVALRSPELFVEVANEMLRFSRWTPPGNDANRPNAIALKSETGVGVDAPAIDNSSQPAEAATSTDVKPSTEVADKDMADAPKLSDSKRPVVENPDGVVHFLLCELVNYREVDDKEPTVTGKETQLDLNLGNTSSESIAKEESTPESKDKKPTKPQFKAEEHPIFVYRCFLLNCLSELLQSYTRAKVEFINFKRSAPPLSTGTPIKPRTSILNYLIYDLLCQSTLTGSVDNIVAKKKAATSAQTQKVLVALVSKTSERPVDQKQEKFVYDEEPDLLFVRKFVLDTILRAYEKTPNSDESMETRYARLQCLAELMISMIGDKDREQRPPSRTSDKIQSRSQAQLRRLMYEKGYLDKLTSSIAELNLNYPGVKRAIKYVLRVLRILTDTAKELSHSNLVPSDPQADQSEDDFESTSSLSDLDDDREETPDLYRNSALGMLEPRGEDDESESDDEDHDADMYGDEYDEEMDYGDEEMSDGEDDISDEDEELGEMGEIEGLHGDPGVVEVIMDDDDGEDDDEDEEDDSDTDEDEDGDSADMDDMDDRVEIIDEDGNPIEDDPEWESESEIGEADGDVDDIDYEGAAQDDDEAHLHGMGPRDLLDNMARAIMGDGDGYEPELMEGMDEHYLDDDHEDIEDDDEEDIEDEEYFDEDDDYPPEDHGPPMPALGWDSMNTGLDEHAHHMIMLEGQRRPVFARMDHRGGMPPRFMAGSHRDMGDFQSYFSRVHRNGGQQNPNQEDGANPLLRRNNTDGDSAPRPGHANHFGLRVPEGVFNPSGRHMDGPMGLLGELMEFLPMMGRNGNGQHAFHVQISGPGHRGADFGLPRLGRSEQRREISQEPHQAVAFSTESTVGRFNEEARMLFGANHVAEASKLGNAISAALTPDAIELEKKLRAAEEERKREEEARRKLEEEERLAREAKAAEEKAAKEKEEAEQREQEALRARAAGEIEEDNESTAMEGVETAEPSSTAAGTSASGNERSTAPRVMTTIRGEEVDVTQLGIDPDYLAALPEEFREEVIAQTISERRSQARQTAPSGEPTEVFQEFLDALPEELRQEIAQQEAQEQRRRQRDEGRRQAAGATQGLLPTDMDTASILQSFAPELREQVLMDQGQDLMDQLPPEMAAQARLLADQRGNRIRPPGSQPITLSGGHQIAPPGPASGHATSKGPNDGKQARRTVIQMIDKAGVATLLRLMFITQQGSFRNYLFGVFADVCENRQSRLEVISTVLQILQDGTTDIHAVERSFGQLSIKAKRLKDNKDKDREPDQRTPQSLKRTLTTLTVANTAHSSSETSPLLIVQQCLDLLVDLCVRNPHVAWLFLTEHEIIGASIRKAFKGKAKVKDPKANKFAINTLLGLLDRELVTENSTVMTHLADLLNRVTIPLQNLERRRKESLDASAQSGKPNLEDSKEKNADNVDGSSAAPESAGQGESQTAKKDEPQQKRTRQLQPPLIPEENLTLVVRIFVARECSSKTFQNTIATIKNLCAIPGTKAIFGQELTKQARSLSENIVTDLNDLLPHILAAKSGTEIQGVALAKFSPGASEQNKLLRVLTALDHLFDVKKKNVDASSDSTNNGDKQDWLTPLYHNETFIGMWDKLSACLSAIRQRENMLSVATILLPLIESLMVVCKNTTAKEDTAPGQPTKEGAASSPQEESQTASLFFTFTEEHRRILNELVRHSPKLMSGTFALLVRNPKVLEFDNKRNYFNRSVHSRSQNSGRASVPLSLSVRRESVFRDSFTALYYKSGEEIKHGKLNIRFNGEEGVDAGGVTREWFQVLARQMFDPNNALFIPVSSDRTTFHPNKLSKYQRDDTDHQLDHLMFFKFIGRIIGKALYEGRLLDCFFSRAVYKRILGKSVSVKDMESFDPDYYKSLCWMLENDITDIITETFSEEEDEFGVTKTVDLIPNGRDIPVTEENKHEYVRLVVRHRLLSSVQDQMEAFLKGFHEIIPAELISIFNEQELELLISGLPDIDIDDWRSNTEYHNYTASSPQVQWFWRTVRSLDKEELAKLLQFVTGTSKVPLNGFKELEGMNGISRFNIHRNYGDKDRLPTSHTCFNQLDLPEYDSYDTLRAQLVKAITAGNEYFGFA